VTPTKPSTTRVEALRAARAALGLRRREVYCHDDDWPAVQALAAKLQAKREAKRKA
jgi:hypothetical protein